MRIIINESQLQLLASQFHLIEGRGLVHNENKLITESKMNEYLVTVVIGGFFAQIRIGAQNHGMALQIVRKLFPKARITGAVYSA